MPAPAVTALPLNLKISPEIFASNVYSSDFDDRVVVALTAFCTACGVWLGFRKL